MRLFFLFVVLTGTSYAQIGLAQLQWMYKADLDAFVTKAIEENYKFDEIVKTTNFGNGTKYLEFFKYSGRTRYLTKFPDNALPLNYQTSETSELSNYYIFLKKYGYTLKKTQYDDIDDFDVLKIYEKENELIEIHIRSNWLEIAYSIEQ